MTRINQQVGRKIREILKGRGMTAERLAYEMGMSKGYLSSFLQGKKGISLDSLKRIADGLDIKIRDLFPAS